MISEKMKEAEKKGVTDSAVILKDAILIASNKTTRL